MSLKPLAQRFRGRRTSEASAETVMMPETVEPEDGEEIETEGAAVLPAGRLNFDGSHYPIV